MSKEQAYCCLNCTTSANCCGECGGCESCCENCDTSACKSSAYFKDGNFYLNYTSKYNGSSDYEWSDNADYQKGNSSFSYSYNSKNDLCSASGSITHLGVHEDGDATFTSTGYGGSNGIEGYGCGCDTNDFCWNNGSCNSGPNGDADPCCASFTGGCGVICADDECGSFNFGCSGLECVCDDEEWCDGTYVSENSATISFQDTVRLYNSEGEDVGNIVGASYNPCNPCATWGAPSCHYFST